MAKHTTVVLFIRDGKLQGIEALSSDMQNKIESGPAIYVYRSAVSKKVYISQTIHFKERNAQHYSGGEEKFNTADFTRGIDEIRVGFWDNDDFRKYMIDTLNIR